MTYKPEILHAGYDGLTIAYQGAVSAKVLDDLESAKASAKERGAEVSAKVGDLSASVKGFGTNANQGYTYLFSAGDLSISWAVKKSVDNTQWNLRAIVSAGLLATMGLDGARERLAADLKAMRAKVITESVGRIDYCVDIQMDEDGTKSRDAFRLDPMNFVAHARTSRTVDYAQADKTDVSDEVIRVFGRRYVETVTLGKMPGRQIQVYNKRAEAVKFQKSDWFAIWGKDKKECPNIWRVEVRLGKEYLRDYNISTLDDVRDSIGDLFIDSLCAVRYVKDANVSNITRDSENHELWEVATAAIIEAHEQNVSGIVRGRLIEIKRKDARKMFEQQVAGLASGLTVIVAYPDRHEMMTEHPEYVAGIVRNHMENEKKRFEMTRQKALARMRFIGEGESDPDMTEQAA